MVPCRSYHIRLEALSLKEANKWGYKLWAHAGMSGYAYEFEVEGCLGSKGAPVDCIPPTECGEIDFVVLRLTNGLEPYSR